MSETVLVALVAFAGTVIGTFGGIVTSSKLTNYRLRQLEKKVDAHNNFATRIPLVEKELKVMGHRVNNLERRYFNEN